MAVTNSPPLSSARPWLGVALVIGSATAWSYGGAIQRFIGLGDGWAIVFWRCLFGGLFLLSFMLIRDGASGTVRLFRDMGWPGLLVAMGFAAVSTCFVLAVSMTPVANVVLFMAAIPLFAALLARVFLGEPITPVTWGAIAAVIAGVAIMVSASIGEGGSVAGLALAASIPVFFACMTVLTRAPSADPHDAGRQHRLFYRLGDRGHAGGQFLRRADRSGMAFCLRRAEPRARHGHVCHGLRA